MPEQKELVLRSGADLLQAASRRQFLKVLGVGGSVIMLPSMFTACNDDTNVSTNPGGGSGTTYSIDLSNDTGILNYAYALEQLEAAYYTAALTSTGFAALSANEQEVLSDLQKHEVIHREWFKTILGSNAIPTISFNTTTVGTLTASRDVLLRTSQQLEDTGVSAYNGAGKYLTNTTNLLLAGKIVSVEARHAAAIRDIRDGTNGRLFAGDDVVSATTGLDVKAEPGAVVTAVNSLNVVSGTLAGSKAPTGTATADAPAPTPT